MSIDVPADNVHTGCMFTIAATLQPGVDFTVEGVRLRHRVIAVAHIDGWMLVEAVDCLGVEQLLVLRAGDEVQLA